MKIEIDIPDDKLQNLSPTAKTEMEKVAKQYTEEVLDEASRIEESRRTSNSNPEITAAIINDPEHGAAKQLNITFEINGIKQTKTFNEGDKVIIEG